MFCPAGYVTLTELWKDFFATYRVTLNRTAMESYGRSDFELADACGSPDDYCEDVFLSTLADLPVFAAKADGHVTHLETVLDEGRSNLFAKMSAFESFLVASDPKEAGLDGFWLRRLGSDHFEAWDVSTRTLDDWKLRFNGTDSDASKRPCFHTLPFAFERGRYLVPDEAPPWICDVIDEHYLPRMITAFGGCALCVEAKAANKWRERVLTASQLPRLDDQTEMKPSSIGRPNKTNAIKEAYQRLFPDGRNKTWKEVARLLEKETGLSLSVKTAQRANDELSHDKDKTQG
ncbi:hypothetical protein [Pseudotabrizicola sp.]|uniref:hypothetical protein n=1 Tax=Pseudotabrizicola sp. TaxID=2939647 RepID=UPI00271EBEF7|nr:hypothetical protein [Pseudotabrizicola sp.]MDO8884929.1 hypothetical protein [Pseudotabrizicola sp.]